MEPQITSLQQQGMKVPSHKHTLMLVYGLIIGLVIGFLAGRLLVPAEQVVETRAVPTKTVTTDTSVQVPAVQTNPFQ